MNIKTALQTYYNELKNISVIGGGAFNEHSFRTPLENLLNTLKPSVIEIIHEPKAKEGQGHIRPDFKVYKRLQNYEALQGFIECKPYKEDLDILIKGKQISKYLAVCPNILLSDYNRFILLNFGKVIYDITLFPYGLENELFKNDKTQNIELESLFTNLLNHFFELQTSITDKDELVRILSTQSFYLSQTIFTSDKSGLLNTQFKESFEKAFVTFTELENTPFSKVEFCDILAQSVVYGMFVAYIENDEFEIDKIPIQSYINLLPQHFLTLQEFVYYSLPFFALPDLIKYALENIKKTIALIDKISLSKSFKQELTSLSIYLYEDFLKAFDNLRGEQRRKEGGVFYTPSAVVNMICCSLNELLQSKFHLKGFKDDSVKVLDFATGTGSFLVRVFELILENESEVFQNQTIVNKCFKDIYGFELGFVPYIVAHLKLSFILRQKGFHNLNATQKFQIFLTNTLDLDDKNLQMQVPFDSLRGQRDRALELKSKENLLVILGNPPYNVKSKNKGEKILKLLQSYKVGLNETKINLDDDYIKFIRFAQYKLLEQGQKQGLMGFITNNSYLFGRTHRKMRQSLASAFDEIYILNLHGDADTDGKDDKNVFEIKQGVCISLFVKYSFKQKEGENATIFYYSTKDNEILRRQNKFNLLNDIAEKGLNSIKWQELNLKEPYFWFVPKNFENDEYENFWALAENKALGESKAIFEIYGSGISTDRDNLTIDDNKDKLKEKCKKAFSGDFDKQFKIDFKIHNSSSYPFEDKLKNLDFNENAIYPLHYRPFDKRFIYYEVGFTSRPAYEVMQHFLQSENLGLCFPKTCLNSNFDYGLVIDKIADRALGGKNTGSETCIAPLYLYQDSSKEVGKISKIPNFTREFSEFKAQSKILKDKSPEQILAFIYANLFNPHYRTKYLEYLKIGFPRVNFEVSESEFNAYEKLGSKLISLHLLQNIPHDNTIKLEFRANANNNNPSFTLTKLDKIPLYANEIITINKDLQISGISKEIYEFSIGGYKVLDKWLKYRVGRALSKAELEHLLNIAKIIKESLKIQKELSQISQ